MVTGRSYPTDIQDAEKILPVSSAHLPVTPCPSYVTCIQRLLPVVAVGKGQTRPGHLGVRVLLIPAPWPYLRPVLSGLLASLRNIILYACSIEVQSNWSGPASEIVC